MAGSAAAAPGSRIFICYRREDTEHAAGRLAEDLRRHFAHEQVIQDIASIDPGADFIEALQQGLDTCAAVLVVIGPRWVAASDPKGHRRLDLPGDWVRHEVAESLKRPGVRVFPVLVGDAVMPSAEDLPQPLQALTRRQAFELTSRHWVNDVAQLVEHLKRVPGLDRPQGAGKPEERAPFAETLAARLRMRSVQWVLLAAAITGAIGVTWRILHEDSQPPTSTQPPTPLAPPQNKGTVEPPETKSAVKEPALTRIFSDNFSDGNADRWYYIRGGWSVGQDSGNYYLQGKGHSHARPYQGENWTDYMLEARVKLLKGGIHLEYLLSKNGGGRYYIGFREDEIYINKQLPPEKFITLAEARNGLTLDRWHLIQIKGKEGKIEVYVDSTKQLEYLDSSPLENGGIGFETLDDSEAYVDDVIVVPFLSH